MADKNKPEKINVISSGRKLDERDEGSRLSMDELLKKLDRDREISKNNLKNNAYDNEKVRRDSHKEIESLRQIRIDETKDTDEKRYIDVKEAQKEIQLAENYFDLARAKIKKVRAQEVEKLEFDLSNIDTRTARRKENIANTATEQKNALDFKLKEIHKKYDNNQGMIKSDGKKATERLVKTRQRVVSDNEFQTKEVTTEFDKKLGNIHDFLNNAEADHATSISLVNRNLTATVQIVTSQKSRIENSLTSTLRPLRNQMNRELTHANAVLSEAIEQRDEQAEENAREEIARIEDEYTQKIKHEEARTSEMISQQVAVEKDAYKRSYIQKAEADRTKLSEVERHNKDYKIQKLLQDVTVKRLDIERNIRLVQVDSQRENNFILIDKELKVNELKRELEIHKTERDIIDLDLYADFEAKSTEIDAKITKAELERKITEAKLIGNNKLKVAELEKEIKIAEMNFEIYKINSIANASNEKDLLKELKNRSTHIRNMLVSDIIRINKDEQEAINRARSSLFTELQIAKNIRFDGADTLEKNIKKESGEFSFDLSERGKEYDRDFSEYATQFEATAAQAAEKAVKLMERGDEKSRTMVTELNNLFDLNAITADDRLKEITKVIEDKLDSDLASVDAIANDIDNVAAGKQANKKASNDKIIAELQAELDKANYELENGRIEADNLLESKIQAANDEEAALRDSIEKRKRDADDKLAAQVKENKDKTKAVEEMFAEESRKAKDELIEQERALQTELDDFEYRVQHEIEDIEANYVKNLEEGRLEIQKTEDAQIESLERDFANA